LKTITPLTDMFPVVLVKFIFVILIYVTGTSKFARVTFTGKSKAPREESYEVRSLTAVPLKV